MAQDGDAKGERSKVDVKWKETENECLETHFAKSCLLMLLAKIFAW